MGICVSCRRRDRKAPSKSSGGGAAGAAARAKAELLPRRDHLAIMANSISNIKMTNPLKGIVSKRRKRYIKDGFNLDLAYITERLIAMGFPAEKLEGVYRNHIDEVYRFLEHKHKDHYKIYNLCSERSYDSSKFHERVAVYPFDDHSPPEIELIQSFCADVHDWLSKDSKNVAAVHCKAGKGRTGTMVCCYLLYSGQESTADGALNHYGKERTHDLKGVTIPSQRRYVEYYAALVRGRLEYRACAVHIAELALSPPPALNGGQCTLELWVAPAAPASAATAAAKLPACSYEMRRNESEIRMSLNQCRPLAGDVRVELYSKPKMMRKEKLFHFWFNTYFVTRQVGAVRVQPPDDCPDVEVFKLCLNKWQLDDAHKDKQHKLYSPNFKVELIVQKPPERSAWSGGRAPLPAPRAIPHALPPASTPSSSESSEDEHDEHDEHWDSGQVAMLCRSNERLLACGGCQATCRAPTPACAAVCRMGCYCPPGLLRNDTGHCVPLSECPTTSLGHQEQTSEPRATDKSCPENEEYRFCEVCNRTCANPDPVCPAQCARGCFCKEGLLRDEQSGRCVKPWNCQNSIAVPRVPSCPANEEYRMCEPCNRTCERPNPVCPAQCARGCFCKEGLLRNSRGLCVLPHLCGVSDSVNLVVPHPNWLPVCGARQEYRRCGCERTCLERRGACGACSTGCFCAEGWLRARDGRCVAEQECPREKCPNPDEVYECRSTCQEGCNGESECHDRGRGCVLGCYCRNGLVRDFRAGRCVERRHCTNTTTVY